MIRDSLQQVTMKFTHHNHTFFITAVYARYTVLERLELREELEDVDTFNCPWIMGSDFNVILHEKEKMGGINLYPARRSGLCPMYK